MDTLKILAELNRRKQYLKLKDYKPYGHPDTLCPEGKLWKAMNEKGKWQEWSNRPWQLEFHDAGKDNPYRLVMAANGPGKCITKQTLVSTPGGQVQAGVLYSAAKTFKVHAWNGVEIVEADALVPFKKEGLHDCYRLVTRFGDWIECADHHRIWLDGFWQHAQRLYEFVRCRQESNSESCWTVRAEDGRHSNRTPLDSQYGCLEDRRLCGERPPCESESGPDCLRQQGDVQEHTQPWFGLGVSENIYTNIVQNVFGPLSRIGAGRPILNQRIAFEGPFFDICATPNLGIRPEFQLFSNAEVSGPRQDRATWNKDRLPWNGKIGASVPPLLSANDIIACWPIGKQEVYDFTVPEYGNYIAGGLVHHNTESMCAEAAIHLTGRYPDWWTGRRFEEPIKAWACGISNSTQKDALQPGLLGPDLEEGLGSGYLPKDCIVGKPKIRQAGIADVCDTVRIRHTSGGTSHLAFKVYQMGWRAFQAGAPQMILFDEQPNEYNVDEKGIFSEVQTRLFRSQGLFIGAMTPLLGETPLINLFIDSKAKGIFWVGATWDDAPHLIEGEKARLKATYPAHELDARTKGIPMRGEGVVWPVDEKSITCRPFTPPRHFARIKGLDFGIGHPFGAVDCAYDRDRDVFYILACYRKAGATPADHSAWLNHTDPWVPISWPHDGKNREKGSDTGKQLQAIYRGKPYNLRLLGKSARYPKAPGEETEKGGGQATGPIAEEMLERMLTGRLKVVETCHEWFDEFRSYHRKDGRTVDRKDDVLKASMYALMMKRYAATPTLHIHRRSTAAPALSVRV